MKLLRTFMTSDAVEGAVEVRLELSEALHAYRSRFRLLVLALVVGVILVLGTMVVQVGGFVGWVMEWMDGRAGLTYPGTLLGLLYSFFFIISMALGLAIILFNGMMRRYFALLRARYGTFAGGGMGSTVNRKAGRLDADIAEEAGRLRDPARTLLGMAKEAEGEVPQVDDLLKYSTGFALLLAMMSLVSAGLTLLGVTHVPEGVMNVLTVVHVIGTLVLATGVLLQVEAQRFLDYFIARVNALGTFESQGPVPVPGGVDVLERFATCVLARHGLEDGRRGEGELVGASGDRHAFDLVLGGPGERVLVRTFDSVPGIQGVRDLRTAAEDVARREGELPLRVVALVRADLDDLDVDDVVYDYLMEHPIQDGAGERARSLQIVAEVEGHYSVLPFTAP